MYTIGKYNNAHHLIHPSLLESWLQRRVEFADFFVTKYFQLYMFYQGLALRVLLEKSHTLIFDGPVDFLGNTAAHLL